MILVALDVKWFADNGRAIYTFCYILPGEVNPIGSTVLLSEEAYNEQTAWTAGCIEAGCRVLISLAEKGIDSSITIQGDRNDLQDLLKRDWPGELGRSVQRFMRYVENGHIRIKSRAGRKQTTFERMNSDTAHRQVLGELLRAEAAYKRTLTAE